MNVLVFVMFMAIGIVDQINGEVATVEVDNRGKLELIDVPLTNIPCPIREGEEILFTTARDGSEKIRCLK